MPAPPAVGSSPSTPDTPATPPATTRPDPSDETGPVFLDADDDGPAPSPGPSAAPVWNADTSRQGGFGAPLDDPRGGNWSGTPAGEGRGSLGTGAPEPAPSPASPASPASPVSPAPGAVPGSTGPAAEPAPDAADGPLSEHTFRVRRPQRADAAQQPSPSPNGGTPGGAHSAEGAAGPNDHEPTAQGGREFTVGLRRSDVLRGGDTPALPVRSDGPGETQADQPAPAPDSGSPAPAVGPGQVPPARPQPDRPTPPHDQSGGRVPTQNQPGRSPLPAQPPAQAQSQLPAQSQTPAQARPSGLVPGQAQPERPQPAQSSPVQNPPAQRHPATAAPDRAQQSAPPSWAQPPAASTPDSAQGQAVGHQHAAGLPAHPQSGGPDAVTPWRPPVNDPFAQAAQQTARPAGLGRRFCARLLDLVLTLAVGGGVAFPFVGKVTDHIDAKVDAVEQAGETKQVWLVDGTTGMYLGVVLGTLVVFGLLYEVLPTARWGRTLGKKLFGLAVVHIEGHGTPGFGAALVRWLVHGVLGLAVVGLLNVLWCVFDRPWRQCWHDKVARTFVAKGGSAEIRL